MKSEIGANIVKFRKINGISQKYLAEKLNLSVQGLFKIEKGLVSPRAEVLEKAVMILCITPNQLFGFEQITEENSNILERLQKTT